MVERRHLRRVWGALWPLAVAVLAYWVVKVRFGWQERNLVYDEGGEREGALEIRSNPEAAYEASDWRLRPVAIVYAGTIVLLALSCGVLRLAYPSALSDVARSLRVAPPAAPLLQTNPQGDLARFRTEEDERLNSYYWIDKAKGRVHIPIEAAMRKLGETGSDGFPRSGP